MSYVALITGASSGIGEATARLLAARRPHAEIILVARRRDRIDALAEELNAEDPAAHHHVHAYAADLTDADAINGLAAFVTTRFGQLNLLVNNAGARWSLRFDEGGFANVAQTMAINFDAQVRLTEAVLPLLRTAVGVAEPTAGNPATHADPARPRAGGVPPPPPHTPATHADPTPRASIVNVASTAGRIARAGAGAYSASKFALIGWSDALFLELKPEGIHVGLVIPGFIATEGFPQTELVSHPLKRHLVGTVEQAAAAILHAGMDAKPEIYVPGFYRVFAAMRVLTPGLIRRALGGGGFTTQTSHDAAEAGTP
jgi:short-subunit dehydrogenase